MNYLRMAQELAGYKDPDAVGRFDVEIGAIGVVMQILTFGLLLTFGGRGIKKGLEGLFGRKKKD